MTKKRWIVLAGMLAACVCLTLAVLALLPPPPGVTWPNIERINDGMTRAEVETILGGPGESLMQNSIMIWFNPQTKTNVIVYFDDANRVIGKDWGPPETFMQKLQRLLHL